ncbi:hypothetical protein ADIS_1268 [Lunatimonas lonarensis]|uniref:Uncharacterized protein n=1 Tax=Lunatimonas lonarensis TaxID=1232681 RepID=R7ZVB4_9BACT|nr:hypothetical protein [Lunatimonas lonarensis]EON78071.1 hypothetical protein ADIS_1268 [Lunatimonas lonarensis]
MDLAIVRGIFADMGVDCGIIPQAQRTATENSSLAGLLTGKIKTTTPHPPT